MKFAHPQINKVFSWNESTVPTLIIENQGLFRTFLQDIHLAIDGVHTKVVLSLGNKVVDMTKHAELITDFICFDINKKSLLSKICAALEHSASSPEKFVETQQLLAYVENSINDWAFDLSCDISPSNVSVSSILKSAGIRINDDYVGEIGAAEKIVDYMELVREFDRDKLFVTVNMRSFFSDETISKFLATVVSHDYKVLMLESCAYDLIKYEDRLIIDRDLCEI